MAEEKAGGFDGGESRLAEASLTAVVEDDIGRSSMALRQLDAADGSGCDFAGVDWLPVAREDVPVDGGEAEIAGDAKDGGTARSVGRTKVADGHADRVFDAGVAAL